MRPVRHHLVAVLAAAAVLGGCAGSDTATDTTPGAATGTTATSGEPAATATVATETADGAATGLRQVSATAAQDLLTSDEVTVLDVRTPEEYAAGHLEDARLVDISAPDFEQQIAALPRDDRYVVYCRTGNRSAQALAVMERLGFTDVADVDGGIVAWADAGLPLVR